MKRSIFLYLFLFAVLWIVFQYVHNKKYSENAERRVSKLEMQVSQLDSVIASNKEKMEFAQSFTLEGNVNAHEYFEDSDNTIAQITTLVSDAVIERNTAAGNDLVTYHGDKRPYIVNSTQLLNHRWLIAEFSDGNTWGEMLIRYFINEDNSVDLEVIEEILY